MKNDSWSVIIGFANPQLHLAKQLGREILRQEWSSLRRNFRFEATASGSIAPDREDFYRAFHGFGILHFAFCIFLSVQSVPSAVQLLLLRLSAQEF
jgi:hypothetical protein